MPSKRLSNVTQIYVLSSDIHDPSPRPLEPEVTTMNMRQLWSGRNNSLQEITRSLVQKGESGKDAMRHSDGGFI